MKQNVELCLCRLLLVLILMYLKRVEGRPNNSAQIAVNSNQFKLTKEGGFSFNFTTENHFHHEATGEVKNVDNETQVIAVKGMYSYIAANGAIFTVTYTADERGYMPVIKVESPFVPKISDSAVCSICGGGLG